MLAVSAGVNGDVLEEGIRFEKQEGGGWRAIDLPNNQLGTFSLEENQI